MSINQWPKNATADEWAAFKLGREKQKHVTRVASRNHDTLAEACRAIAEKAIEKCKPMPEVSEWR